MKKTREIGFRCKYSDVLSQGILIGRGLDLKARGKSSSFEVSSEFSRQENTESNVLDGDDSEEDPPVPIPNTEVKLFSVEDTWLETAWKNRELPS